MVCTQIRLTEEQAARLKELAHANNESLAATIRKALDQFLSNQQPDRRVRYRQAPATVGKYKASAPDVSIEHDHYLEQDFRS